MPEKPKFLHERANLEGETLAAKNDTKAGNIKKELDGLNDDDPMINLEAE
jgi:hypothetical protein